MLRNEKTPTVLEANILYLIIGLALITIGAKAQNEQVYTGLLITEYLIVLLPTILYLKLKGYSLKNTLKLNKISFKQTIIVIFIVVFSYPVAVFFNFIGIMILSKFTQIRPSPVPIPSTLGQYIIGFLIIALTPGICEEIMFRGMIMSSYESLGRRKAIIYSAILFGLFHFNLQNLLGPIYLGILFGIIVYKTNSLFSTIIGHTVNNTIALTLGYFFTEVEEGIEMFTDIMFVPQGKEMLLGLLSLGLVAIVFGFITYKLIKLLPIDDKTGIIGIHNSNEWSSSLSDINNEKDLNILDSLPILVIIIIFFVWNYKYLLI